MKENGMYVLLLVPSPVAGGSLGKNKTPTRSTGLWPVCPYPGCEALVLRGVSPETDRPEACAPEVGKNSFFPKA